MGTKVGARVGVGTPAGVEGPSVSLAIGGREPVVTSHSRHLGLSELRTKPVSPTTIVSLQPWLQSVEVRLPEAVVASSGELFWQSLVWAQREWESPPEYFATNED